MDEDSFLPSETDQDFSFTSCASTDRTFTSSSARSSLTRSSLTFSFNESRLSSSAGRPHRKSDPHWSAIIAATNLSSDGTLHLRHLKLLRHLGSGNLGRVFLCRLKDYDGANFALKVVDRDNLTNKKLSHVQMESQVLSIVDHPFLPTLYAHLEVSHYTCMLIDYCPGGDLHSLLLKQPGNRFRIDAGRFFAAEVLVALEYLHALGIVYRDLKPENVLIREDGHIMLSDFDLCFTADVVPTLEKRFRPQAGTTKNRCSCLGEASRRPEPTEEETVTEFVAEPTSAFSRSCVGTHEYLAPELVNGNGHGNGVDWWAFGVFVYEMLYGRTPFKGGSKEATLRNIASSGHVRFPMCGDSAKETVEEEGMADARDLMERLLVKDPRTRLGCTKGATDIKRHPFFEGINWPLIRTHLPPDVRGLMRKTKSQYCLNQSPRRRGWSWKGFGYFVKKGSKLNVNVNCYNKGRKRT